MVTSVCHPVVRVRRRRSGPDEPRPRFNQAPGPSRDVRRRDCWRADHRRSVDAPVPAGAAPRDGLGRGPAQGKRRLGESVDLGPCVPDPADARTPAPPTPGTPGPRPVALIDRAGSTASIGVPHLPDADRGRRESCRTVMTSPMTRSASAGQADSSGTTQHRQRGGKPSWCNRRPSATRWPSRFGGPPWWYRATSASMPAELRAAPATLLPQMGHLLRVDEPPDRSTARLARQGDVRDANRPPEFSAQAVPMRMVLHVRLTGVTRNTTSSIAARSTSATAVQHYHPTKTANPTARRSAADAARHRQISRLTSSTDDLPHCSQRLVNLVGDRQRMPPRRNSRQACEHAAVDVSWPPVVMTNPEHVPP